MKIFTYHINVSPEGLENELRLITLWRNVWQTRGIETVVLSEFHARQHPYFSEYDAAISKLPTVNSVLYERACYLRWLALAQVGGGFISDYDVFPKAPGEGHEIFGPPFDGTKFNMFQKKGPCPSFNYVSKETCEWLCQQFATGQFGKRDMEGRDHFSDQYSICDLWTEEEKKPEAERRIILHDYVLGYMDEGWEKARFVHFSNSSTTPRGKTPRWRHIPALLTQV